MILSSPRRTRETGGDGFLPAIEMEIPADLPLPEAALRGILEEADRVHLSVEIERRLGIQGLGFGPVPRWGASWPLLRPWRVLVFAVAATGPSSDDGFLLRLWPFVVAMRSPLAPPADRARGRVAESMLVPWGGTRYQAAAPPRSFAELYRTASVVPVAARHHGRESRTRAALNGDVRGYRQRAMAVFHGDRSPE